MREKCKWEICIVKNWFDRLFTGCPVHTARPTPPSPKLCTRQKRAFNNGAVYYVQDTFKPLHSRADRDWWAVHAGHVAVNQTVAGGRAGKQQHWHMTWRIKEEATIYKKERKRKTCYCLEVQCAVRSNKNKAPAGGSRSSSEKKVHFTLPFSQITKR